MYVAQLWRHPVKSMIGEQVAAADLVTAGMVGDRSWAVRDEVRGGIRGAKKLGALMTFAAAYLDPSEPTAARPSAAVRITLPDGATVGSGDPDVDERISRALEHDVTLWPLQPPGDLDHYRRGAPDSTDLMEELNGIFGREPGEPLPDFSIFPPEIVEYESPPGTYLDAYPLLVMTTSALRTLHSELTASAIDVRRFRPNLVVDTGDEPGHPELGWLGRQLVIGDVVLDLPHACPRCVMVTREIDATVPADRAVLRHIVRELDQNLGVYATVVTPGRIEVGATVELR